MFEVFKIQKVLVVDNAALTVLISGNRVKMLLDVIPSEGSMSHGKGIIQN